MRKLTFITSDYDVLKVKYDEYSVWFNLYDLMIAIDCVEKRGGKVWPRWYWAQKALDLNREQLNKNTYIKQDEMWKLVFHSKKEKSVRLISDLGRRIFPKIGKLLFDADELKKCSNCKLDLKEAKLIYSDENQRLFCSDSCLSQYHTLTIYQTLATALDDIK